MSTDLFDDSDLDADDSDLAWDDFLPDPPEVDPEDVGLDADDVEPETDDSDFDWEAVLDDDSEPDTEDASEATARVEAAFDRIVDSVRRSLEPESEEPVPSLTRRPIRSWTLSWRRRRSWRREIRSGGGGAGAGVEPELEPVAELEPSSSSSGARSRSGAPEPEPERSRARSGARGGELDSSQEPGGARARGGARGGRTELGARSGARAGGGARSRSELEATSCEPEMSRSSNLRSRTRAESTSSCNSGTRSRPRRRPDQKERRSPVFVATVVLACIFLLLVGGRRHRTRAAPHDCGDGSPSGPIAVCCAALAGGSLRSSRLPTRSTRPLPRRWPGWPRLQVSRHPRTWPRSSTPTSPRYSFTRHSCPDRRSRAGPVGGLHGRGPDAPGRHLPRRHRRATSDPPGCVPPRVRQRRHAAAGDTEHARTGPARHPPHPERLGGQPGGLPSPPGSSNTGASLPPTPRHR